MFFDIYPKRTPQDQCHVLEQRPTRPRCIVNLRPAPDQTNAGQATTSSQPWSHTRDLAFILALTLTVDTRSAQLDRYDDLFELTSNPSRRYQTGTSLLKFCQIRWTPILRGANKDVRVDCQFRRVQLFGSDTNPQGSKYGHPR